MEAHRFLDSDVSAPEPELPHFEALGHSGSEHYAGLETFDNPGCAVVTYNSDEIMAQCPVTSQPDWYTIAVQLKNTEQCIESKSLKLFFTNIMRNSLVNGTGIFCESLAVHVRDEIAKALGYEDDQGNASEEGTEHVTVQLVQKARGGISITAIA